MLSSASQRRRLCASRLALVLSTALCSGLAAPAFAQLAAPAPVRQSVDANGVDLFLGTMNVDAPALTMGQGGAQGLDYHPLTRGLGWSDSVTASIDISLNSAFVSIGGSTDQFTMSGPNFTPTQGNGATLTYASGVYTYTSADGTTAHFNASFSNFAPFYANGGRVTDIERPSGARLNFSYESTPYCARSKPGDNDYGVICTQTDNVYRLAAVTNSYGYALTFNYDPDATIDPQNPNPDLVAWAKAMSVTATNAAQGGAGARTESFASSTSGGFNYFTVTDAAGRVTTYRFDGYNLLGITRPGSTSEDVVVGHIYGTSGRTTSVTTAAGSTQYAAADANGTRTVTVTNPSSQTTTYTFDIASSLMTSMTDPLGHTSSWAYTPDGLGHVHLATLPDTGSVEYAYDTRGNVTSTTRHAKPSSGQGDMTTSASYPATCDNPLTCNKPTSATDANGNVTDYGYAASHGGLIRVTGPAPTANAVRPQVRYGYGTLTDFFGQPVYLQTSVSACRTTAGVALDAAESAQPGCAGTADETVSSTSYGTVAGNNLLPASVSQGSGDGVLTATTAMSYDVIGNMVSSDGPLPGTADTTQTFYDVLRRPYEVVSPDPDGSGPLKNRATYTSYNTRDLVTSSEVGTANPDGGGFVSLQQVSTDYDAADRRVKQTASAGGSVYGVTQYSYDVTNRVVCGVVRMNPSTWATIGDACSYAPPPTGVEPDRITRVQYDELGRPKTTTSAYGTGAASTDASLTYTTDGQTETATDGNGNVTTYAYDGFDRLLTTRYPDTTTGAGTSSTTDYEQFGYDANSNVTSKRLRDGQSIGLTYDALNRASVKTRPASEGQVSYGYDLLGRLTSATDSATGITETLAYDGLGRVASDGQAFGSTAYQYDSAGRRTRLTWNDGVYVDYDHLVTGEVTAIRENGASSGIGVLASYAYDDLGRTAGITYGNGTSTAYGFDGISRLQSLELDLGGTAKDLSLGFGYTPASQIASNTRSNDAYAYTPANKSDAYTINGLNQATAAGGTALGYDARGNTTSIGAVSYTYGSENLLKSASGGVSLYYDPFDRLVEYDTNVSTRFLYDSAQIAGELNPAGTVERRYVYGPGDDAPIVWYEGSGTSDRRFLHSDERGSIVAVSDGSGTPIATNSYDEYGTPAPGNIGRFQYTGQAWLPELKLYDYKARMYAPSLGRFMQTDPIGYGDGTNWYGYVGGDPVNARDPKGLRSTCADGASVADDDCSGHGGATGGDAFENGGGANGITSNTGSILPGVAEPYLWVNGRDALAAKVNGTPVTGFYWCTNCGDTAIQDGKDVVVTAPNYIYIQTSIEFSWPKSYASDSGWRSDFLKNDIAEGEQKSDHLRTQVCLGSVGDSMRSSAFDSSASGVLGGLAGAARGEGFGGPVGAAVGWQIGVDIAGLRTFLTDKACK